MIMALESRDEPFDPPLNASSADEPRPMRLAVPLLLAAGWGALLTFSVMFLIEDGRNAVAAIADRSDGEPVAEPRRQPARIVPAVETVAAAKNAVAVASAAAEPLPPATSAPPSSPPADRAQIERGPIERVDYVGTWGPTPQACGATARRRGYLPAMITEDGARAGRTLCRFRNGRRDGIAWTVSADCSERGRNWTSQVRLVVDGDRLTWSSAKGSSAYVRCGRRDG